MSILKREKVENEEEIYFNFINSLKSEVTKENLDPDVKMFVCPVSFAEHGKELLGIFRHVVSKGWFKVSDSKHSELVMQMRTAKFQDNSNLDKSQSGNSTYDVFDSTRLALKMYQVNNRR